MFKIQSNKYMHKKLGIFASVIILIFTSFFLIKTKQGAVAKEREEYNRM